MNKKSRYYVLSFFFLIMMSGVVNGVYDDRHSITINNPPNFYAGETKTVTATILNNNEGCDYDYCTWSAGDSSGTTGWIYHGGNTETISFSVAAPSGGYGSFQIQAYANCHNVRSISCWWDDELTDSKTAYYGGCGDGSKDSGENCANCPQDASCSSNQACSGSGQCLNLGTNENCGSAGDRCSSNQECVNKQCKSKCGNQRKDSGEQCDGSNLGGKTCKSVGYDYGSLSCTSGCSLDKSGCMSCQDECSSGQKTCVGDGYKSCQTDSNGCRKWSSVSNCGTNTGCSNGNCISLNTAQNCGAIGNSCGSGFCSNNKCVECRTTSDCASKKGKESTGKYECSTDRKGRYEIFVEKGGQCTNGKCTGSNEIRSNYLDSCGDNVCYNRQCGCPEGYGKCDKTWNCVKRATILVGQPCDCSVQCESGFCKGVKCVKPIDVTLSSTKATLKPGEETIVTLTISSNLNDDVLGSATLKIGSGTEIVDIRSTVSECTGNICKITGALPGRDTEEITVTLKSNSEVTIPISADVSYKVEGQDVQIKKSKSIEFTESKKKPGSTAGISVTNLDISKIPHNYLVIGVVAIVILILVIIYFIGKSHRPKKKHKETKESKKSEKEGKEKKEESKVSRTVAKEIEELHELMEKGILTKREFEKKKKQLLKKG